MSKMSFSQALGEAIKVRMRENPDVVIFGEDVAVMGGTYGVSKGMLEEFGAERVRDTPISESGFVGAAVGAAVTGLRPIAELMMCDFMTVCLDQIVNQAAKMRYMFGGNISVPVVVRMASGFGNGGAAQHSQSLEAWVTHVPGLKVVYPSSPQDAYGLMLSAIDDDNPVIFFEHKRLYATKGEVESLEPIPLGKGKLVREGKDVSIVTYGKQVYDALEAAAALEKDGIEAEIIDLRTLFPLDKELIAGSVSKTHRAVVITEENRRGGFGGELSAIISEEMFDMLDAPVARIGALNTPAPYSPQQGQYYMPNEADILPMARLSLTADHRVVDGAVAARFLQRVKHLVENPAVLLA